MPVLFLRPGFFYVHILENHMPPIFTKALFDFVLPAFLAIALEMINSRKSSKKHNQRS